MTLTDVCARYSSLRRGVKLQDSRESIRRRFGGFRPETAGYCPFGSRSDSDEICQLPSSRRTTLKDGIKNDSWYRSHIKGSRLVQLPKSAM
jgi:hypothetical protein